ncbi:MAG: 2-amino-4-ketopentanoate thiolase [Deltaproteobacteria bacterium]|nr:MAG: 2-amino-4-ketopentanoate thiolase [Deltaproteobacteria bacterium]
MADAKRGDLVQIHKTVLEPDQRPDNLPSCTKSVPYQCWIKGFLIDEDARIGDVVKIQTFIGREISGILYQVSPIYDHNFGESQRELLSIGNEVRKQLEKT